MIIDACSHMFHSTCLDQLSRFSGAWVEQKLAFHRESAQKKPVVYDVNQRLVHLDRNGIDFQVVTPPHQLYSNFMPAEVDLQLAVVRIINDGMARIMDESKGRLISSGTLPLIPFDDVCHKEMERAIRTLGLKAMSLPSNFNGKPLDMPEFEPFWEQAAEMGIPVYIHPNDPAGYRDRGYEAHYGLAHVFGWPYETMLMLSRLIFSGVMDRYPSLKIVSHHLGGGIPFLMGRINECFGPDASEKTARLTTKKPLQDYFSLFYYDTAVGNSKAAIKCTYDVFGADHIVFATDYPFGPGTGESRLRDYPRTIKSSGVPASAVKKILAGNARKLFGLP